MYPVAAVAHLSAATATTSQSQYINLPSHDKARQIKHSIAFSFSCGLVSCSVLVAYILHKERAQRLLKGTATRLLEKGLQITIGSGRHLSANPFDPPPGRFGES